MDLQNILFWPRSVEVVRAFPVSGAGKVLKRELRKELRDG